MELDADEIQAAYYGLAQFVRQRAIAGRGCPPAVTALYRRIDTVIRAPSVSESGHENGSGAEQYNVWITAAQAAPLLGLSKRQTQRLAADLGGQLIGGRWLFNQETVREYAGERTSSRDGTGPR